MAYRRAILIVATSATLAVSACAPAESEADRMMNVAGCGVMTKLLSGDIPVNASNIEDVQVSLELLSEKGLGAVKSTAQYVLGGLDGTYLDIEDERQIQQFKDYCRKYVPN